MSALRGLFGCWLLLSGAIIEFYARRYEYSGTPLLPQGAIAIVALAIVFLPPRAFARLPLPRHLARTLAVGIVCATALLFAALHPLQFVHLLISGTLLAGALLLLAPLLVLPVPVGIARIATALVLATLSFALLAYYGILIIGLETWNEVVSRELLWTYAWQLPELIAALPISNWIPWTLGGALFAALALAHWLAAPGLAAGLRTIGVRARRYLMPARRLDPVRTVIVIMLLGVFAALADLQFETVSVGDTPDPLVTTFLAERKPPGTLNMPFVSAAGLDTVEREAAARYAVPARVAAKTLVLITVDALRADQMNVYGHARDNTPFLSRLHREGRLARFDNVFAACTESLCGLLATLTARYWHELGAARRRFGLADVLKRVGYRNEYLLSGDHTNFYNLRSFYGENVDRYVDGASGSGYMNDDSDILQWAAGLEARGAEPRFIYIHLMSVHVLGKRLPQHRVWYKTEAGASGIPGCCSPHVDFVNKYHDGILQADAVIEALFRILRVKRLLDDAVVAITGDHGEMLGERGDWGHGSVPYDPVVRVPLLIFDPEGFRYPPQPLASVIDIAPTLLDRIGAPIPEHWSGRPLTQPAARRFALMQARTSYAVVGSFGGELFKYYYFRDTNDEKLVKLAGAGAEHAVSFTNDYAEILRDLRGELDLRLPALRRAR